MGVNLLMTPPTQLDHLFTITAHFYEIASANEQYHCRSVLEIVRTAATCSAVDAVVVMMNPGGSYPLADVTRGDLSEPDMVRTNPDMTQYQVMRVMEIQTWSRVRVLN